MRLCFLGDISVAQPGTLPNQAAPVLPPVDLMVANLEGVLVDASTQERLARSNQMVFYNSHDVLDVLRAFGVQVVCLANNHQYDLPQPAAATQDPLAQAGIASFGAGAQLSEASQPFEFDHAGTSVKLFAFGWDVIGCRTAAPGREGVNPLQPGHVLDTIRRVRAVDTRSCVVFLMHWNYELEPYPQPAHRQLAHDLIDLGVDAVIGMHPHVVGGAECVAGKPIVYSLGNWFLPERRLGPLHLAYPPAAARELALEIEFEGRTLRAVQFHWCDFETRTNTVQPVQSEGWDGALLSGLTPYAGMSHPEYVRWFKDHRTRTRGLPVYADYRATRRNQLADQYVKMRQRLIQILVQLRVKGGPSAPQK